jgi:hypothetical protein
MSNQGPTDIDTQTVTTASCEGCAGIPAEAFGANQQWYTILERLPGGGSGPYPQMGGFHGSDGNGQSYNISNIECVASIKESGSCAADSVGSCAPLTSCEHEISLNLIGTFTSPNPDWEGPGFEFLGQPGWKNIPGSPHVRGIYDPLWDPADEVWVTTIYLDWYFSFKAGCGQSVESFVHPGQFRLLHPEAATFSNNPTNKNEPNIRLRMGCKPCVGDPDSDTPSDETTGGTTGSTTTSTSL